MRSRPHQLWNRLLTVAGQQQMARRGGRPDIVTISDKPAGDPLVQRGADRRWHLVVGCSTQ